MKQKLVKLLQFLSYKIHASLTNFFLIFVFFLQLLGAHATIFIQADKIKNCSALRYTNPKFIHDSKVQQFGIMFLIRICSTSGEVFRLKSSKYLIKTKKDEFAKSIVCHFLFSYNMCREVLSCSLGNRKETHGNSNNNSCTSRCG